MKRNHLVIFLSAIVCFLFIISCKKNPVSPPAPTISAISPANGTAGTAVTITGTNFSPTASDNTVKFNGVATTVTSATPTSLVVNAPAGGTTGKVSVSTINGSADGPTFTYNVAPPPTITSISPTSGSANTVVTINGTNFKTTPTDNTVKFNGTVATVQTATATVLTVLAPSTGTSGAVTVATVDGTSNGITYTYITGPVIYASGAQTDGSNGYWANSTFNKIAACNNPAAIAGSGTDIYIAGGSSTNTPTYWKNGTAVQLSAQTGYLVSIFVSGTDVYCVGGIGTSLLTWKNGTAATLTTTGAGAAIPSGNHSLFVSGADVYAAGWENGAGIYRKATYWKNGTPVFLTSGTTSSAQATAVYVSGTDVYVAGTEEELSGGGVVNNAPRLWKNGVAVPLNIPANSLFNNTTSVLLVGADVYVGGQYNGAGALWKNGAMINTASYALAEQVSSIFLFNNTDLYISGSSSVSGLNGYWKNGSFVEMDPGCNVAGPGCAVTSATNVTGIYVK